MVVNRKQFALNSSVSKRPASIIKSASFSITAFAEVGRAVRFINIAFGAWLIAAPWLLEGVASPLATGNGVISGVLLILLALPRGRVRDSYAGWNRYVV